MALQSYMLEIYALDLLDVVESTLSRYMFFVPFSKLPTVRWTQRFLAKHD